MTDTKEPKSFKHGATWEEYNEHAEPGDVLVFDDGKIEIVGNINTNGGVCECCSPAYARITVNTRFKVIKMGVYIKAHLSSLQDLDKRLSPEAINEESQRIHEYHNSP